MRLIILLTLLLLPSFSFGTLPFLMDYEQLEKKADAIAVVSVEKVEETERRKLPVADAFNISNRAEAVIKVVLRGDIEKRELSFEYDHLEATEEAIKVLSEQLSQTDLDLILLGITDSLSLETGADYLVFFRRQGDDFVPFPFTGAPAFKKLTGAERRPRESD